MCIDNNVWYENHVLNYFLYDLSTMQILVYLDVVVYQINNLLMRKMGILFM